MTGKEIVESRNEQYGDPVERMTKAAVIASIITGKELTALDICRIMQALKMTRQAYKHYDDNLLDLQGYLEMEKMIQEQNQYPSKEQTDRNVEEMHKGIESLRKTR
jgi:hypothetical protein